MNVLIYGYGLHGGGFSNAMYFLHHGDQVRLTDIRDEKSLGESAAYLKTLGVTIIANKHRVEDFKWADLVVKTPAISPDNEFLPFAKKVTNDFTCLFSHPEASNVKFIFVTGSTGKTIASSAVCFVLQRLGIKARMCGNMGISPFTELEKWENGDVPECLICEFSATQLRDTKNYLGDSMPQVEIVLMSSSLDDVKVLGSNTKYIICPKECKRLVSKELKRNSLNLKAFESLSSSMPADIPSNLASAYSVLVMAGLKKKAIIASLKAFKGIPNREEFVTNIGNTIVINDSSSTIPQALAFTLLNYAGLPVHLICGGTEDNFATVSLDTSLKGTASITLLDGSFTRKKIIPILNKLKKPYAGPFRSMEEAVNSALSNLTEKNTGTEVVLLSPGASAFELFNDEFDRGDKFKACFNQQVR